MPEEVRNLCRLADISSKSLLLQLVRQETPEKTTALVEKWRCRPSMPRIHAAGGSRADDKDAPVPYEAFNAVGAALERAAPRSRRYARVPRQRFANRAMTGTCRSNVRGRQHRRYSAPISSGCGHRRDLMVIGQGRPFLTPAVGPGAQPRCAGLEWAQPGVRGVRRRQFSRDAGPPLEAFRPGRRSARSGHHPCASSTRSRRRGRPLSHHTDRTRRGGA